MDRAYYAEVEGTVCAVTPADDTAPPEISSSLGLWDDRDDAPEVEHGLEVAGEPSEMQ